MLVGIPLIVQGGKSQQDCKTVFVLVVRECCNRLKPHSSPIPRESLLLSICIHEALKFSHISSDSN